MWCFEPQYSDSFVYAWYEITGCVDLKFEPVVRSSLQLHIHGFKDAHLFLC